MKTYQKVVLALVVCGVGLGAVLWLRKGKPTNEILGKELIPVEAVIAKSGSISRKVTTAGTLVADKWVELRPEVDGKITKILVDEGNIVKTGQPLFQIDDALYKVKVRESEARVALAKVEYERASKLLEKKFASIADRDKKFADLQISEANLEEAKIRLENTQIRAPFDGNMGFIDVSVGALVSASTLLATVVNLNPIYVDFSLPESYLPNVHVADVVDITIEDFDILPIEGTISAISPEINEQTRTVLIRAVISNNQYDYRPGQYARVLIEAGNVQNAVLIPETAIEREGEEDFVMLVVDKVAIRSTVSTGMRDGNQVEITHGVKAGDMVISAGQFKVRDGDEVNVVNQDKLIQSNTK